MPRFVILRHEMPPGRARASHWDFMLEQGDHLSTWALAVEPSAGCESPAEKLPDHRRLYLDYEGPVSNDRGTVTRWDQGTYRLVSASDDGWVVELSGERLIGRATLNRQHDHFWIVAFSAVSTAG